MPKSRLIGTISDIAIPIDCVAIPNPSSIMLAAIHFSLMLAALLPFVSLSIFNNKLGVACDMQPIRAIPLQSPSLSSVNSLDVPAPVINTCNNMLSVDTNA